MIRPLCKRFLGRFCDAKVNDLDDRPMIVESHKYIAGLEISMDDSLIVSMLNSVTDVNKQPQTFLDTESMLIAISRDWSAFSPTP